MKRWGKGLLGAAVALALVPAADAGVSLLLRSGEVRRHLTARLESAFGRPVEVGGYRFSLWEGPRIEADSVTVEEAPPFGHEYFLRARSLAATLRWSALLAGRVEFASFSLSQPSLNVVDSGGRWNLADWLARTSPGAPSAPPRGTPGGSRAPRLYQITVSGGRIDFKHGVDKLPFALVAVKGSVEERAPGRWAISLEAQPMRAAVDLQEAGTLHLSGEVGGASARLRPARLHLHWDEASLSDTLRLLLGNDYGVRGRDSLDIAASSNGSLWHFELGALARGIHRWDFVSQPGNPAVNVRMTGTWAPEDGRLTLAKGQLSASGSAVAVNGEVSWPVAGVQPSSNTPWQTSPQFRLDFTSSGIAAQDLLAWYRSFHSGISPDLAAAGWLQGSLEVAGWPPRLHQAQLSSKGVRVEGAGWADPAALRMASLTLSPSGASLVADADLGAGAGGFRVTGSARALGSWKYQLVAKGHAADVAALVGVADRLGAGVPSYWKEFEGGAGLSLQWKGRLSPFQNTFRALVDLRDARWRGPSLPAGVKMTNARIEVTRRRLRVDIRRGEALGAAWRGWLERALPAGPWQFDLAADKLNLRGLAANFEPRRQRPSLLDRIFGLGDSQGSPPAWLASLDASGRLEVGELSVAPLAVDGLDGRLVIHGNHVELARARGRFYGGRTQGLLVVSVRNHLPVWHVTARVQNVELGAMARAIEGRSFERFSGRLSGNVDASARGTTAAALLHSLDGEARVSIVDARDKSMNWLAALEAGHAVRGNSAFPRALAEIRLAPGRLAFENLRLYGPRENLVAAGTLDFARGSVLEIEAHTLPARGADRPGRRIAERSYHFHGSAASPPLPGRAAALGASAVPR